MPVYEFRCLACKAKFSALIGMVAEPDDESCPKCGSKETRRLVSRFARARSEDDRIDELADRVETMGEPDSPGAMRRLVRDMGKAMDEDMADEMEEMYEADLSGAGGDDE
ncbi:MAG: zinc ribbon domain-containing protein [Fimbriimonadaceae bacterium]|nr:zinc ribbon domain-containing protein [Fimbriimonadaceae bacterium]